MASAVEALWQWFFIVLLFLTILILICCCGGCYEPFTRNFRGFCSEGCDCGLGMFRRNKSKKKKKKVTIVDPKRQGEPGVVSTPGGVAVKVDETEEDEDGEEPDDGCLRSCCGGLFAVITCWYCCGTLAPEEQKASRELRRPLVNVAQPVMVAAPPKKPAPTKPNAGAVAPVVAVPTARVEVPDVAEVVGTEALVASHMPLLTL